MKKRNTLFFVRIGSTPPPLSSVRPISASEKRREERLRERKGEVGDNSAKIMWYSFSVFIYVS